MFVGWELRLLRIEVQHFLEVGNLFSTGSSPYFHFPKDLPSQNPI